LLAQAAPAAGTEAYFFFVVVFAVEAFFVPAFVSPLMW
jgi:hypothetical protein